MSIVHKSIRAEVIDFKEDQKELEDTEMQNNELGFSVPKSYADFNDVKNTSNFLDRSVISKTETMSQYTLYRENS